MKKVTIFMLFMSMFLVACNDNGKQLPQREASVACSADVRECASGSFVTRNPDNNCDFDICQGGEISTDCKSNGGCAPQININ
jgi:hypothetical protein